MTTDAVRPAPPATGDGTAVARAIADAVLYEGYVLFPYHATAIKNRYRWQFGVLVPAQQVAAEGDSGSARVRSQVLLAAAPSTSCEVVVRYLHPLRRQVERRGPDGGYTAVETIEVDGQLCTTWEEGSEGEQRLGPHVLAALAEESVTVEVHLEARDEVAELRDTDGALVGRVRWTTEPVDMRIDLRAELLGHGRVRLTTEVANVTRWSDAHAPRAEVVRHGVAGVHLLLTAAGGRFASAIDPPPWAADVTLDNVGTYPVLVGEDDEVVLSAPIILYDHPQIADESPGDAYDATEIHELLSLCTASLTAEEKRAARATDPRAATVIDEADHLPPDVMARLHGAVRELGGVRLHEPDPDHPLTDELAAFLGVGDDPITSTRVGEVEVEVGDRVRLEPSRRADAQDAFVSGRTAIVGRIVENVEGEVQVGVTLEDDPGADLHTWYGRYLYFHVDEVSPVSERGGTP